MMPNKREKSVIRSFGDDALACWQLVSMSMRKVRMCEKESLKETKRELEYQI